MQDLTKYLPDLSLLRLGDEEAAGLWITSLPWPRAQAKQLNLNSQSTYNEPLGQWPGEAEVRPRRLLLVADGGNSAPEQVNLSALEASTPAQKFTVGMELFERSPHEEYIWERHLLRLRYGRESIGLAMGLRTGNEVHWWEACRLVMLEETEQCLIVEMGGAIPLRHMTLEELKGHQGLTNPYLHKHNWLNGHIYARLHSNGVSEIFAHHINSKFFDDGLDLKDAVPVIGIQSNADANEIKELCGAWDGSRAELKLGNVRFDVSEVARLATPQQPGEISEDGNFLVWKPYQGMELYGGACAQDLLDDPFIFHAQDHIIPRGMARTLRFSISLSNRSPRVVRYLAPAWWYGVCEEFLPQSLLPVSNEYDEKIQSSSRWVLKHIVRGGFEDGSVPRQIGARRNGDENARCEPGWEGEIPYAQFLRAWRSGDVEEYSCALRSAYHFTDVIVDHAAKAVRMHGYPPHAFSVPMNRVQGTLAAYLETGDPYLRETAEAVTANSYWTHKNSWPRLAVGRDACFVRSAVLLYRYFADDFFRRLAHDTALDVIHSQRENGSFGDQGGGSGIHQWGGYITKPWMGLLALNGVLDYLELFPDEPVLLEGVRKFADWLMTERFEHNGVMGWSYQHDFDGKRRFYNPFADTEWSLPGPDRWHHDSLGRLLAYCTLRFDAPEYLDAWAQSRKGQKETGDHAMAATLQFVPWVQAKMWRASLEDDGVHVRPLHFGVLTPERASVLSPAGELKLRWTRSCCEVDTARGISVMLE